MGVLAGDRDHAPDVVLAVLANILSGHRHPAALGIEEPQQQVCDRRLAGAARTEQRDPLARLEPEADAVDRGALLTRIPRRHTFERHRERPPAVPRAGRAGSRTAAV